MFEWLLNHSKAMGQAARRAVGPDVLIVVNTTGEQAEFWQKRLSKDGIKGAGTIAKENAVILSVSEDNWKGGAGNGLGTLNGFILAARKAHTIGLLALDGESDEKALVGAFLRYCRDKSVFMYHTAGKGSRIAPLPAAEINSKSNVKLPEMLPFDGEWKTITILEEGIKETSIYAHSRKNRLSVFWGDQIFIPAKGVEFEGTHHGEIFDINGNKLRFQLLLRQSKMMPKQVITIIVFAGIVAVAVVVIRRLRNARKKNIIFCPSNSNKNLLV